MKKKVKAKCSLKLDFSKMTNPLTAEDKPTDKPDTSEKEPEEEERQDTNISDQDKALSGKSAENAYDPEGKFR